MRWKRVLKKLSSNNLADIFIETMLVLIDAWAIIRTVIILVLVLATIFSSAFTDEHTIIGSLDEKSWLVDWMHSTNK